MSETTSEGYGCFETSMTLEMKRVIRGIEVWIEDNIANIRHEPTRVLLNSTFTDILIAVHGQDKTDPLTIPLEVWEEVKEKWEPVVLNGDCVRWARCSMCEYIDGINKGTIGHRNTKTGSCSNKRHRCPLIDMDFCNNSTNKSRIHVGFWMHRYPYSTSTARERHLETVKCFVKTINIIIDAIKERDGVDNNQ